MKFTPRQLEINEASGKVLTSSDPEKKFKELFNEQISFFK